MKIVVFGLIFLLAAMSVFASSSHDQFVIIDTMQKHDNAFVLVDDLVDAGYPITKDYSRAQMRVLVHEMQEVSSYQQSWIEMERVVSFMMQ